MRRFLSLVFLIAFATSFAWADQPSDPWENYDEVRFMDMDFDENIMTPVVSEEEHPRIVAYMRNLATNLASRRYIVEMDRDDEVIVVVLPTDDLFLPNDTLISPRGLPKLTPLLEYLRDPGMFKVVFAVHTDNTGSHAYNFNLSLERVSSIYDWLLDQINEDLVVIPFPMGDGDPVEPNDSRNGRRANRRIELYLIPGPDMILKARRNQLR